MTDAINPANIPNITNVNLAMSEDVAPKSSEEVLASTKVGSLANLKEVSPDVYQATLKSLAQNILADLRRHKERLKKVIREGRQG